MEGYIGDMDTSEIVLRFSIFFFSSYIYVSAMHRILAQKMFNMNIYASANTIQKLRMDAIRCMSMLKPIQNTFNIDIYASATMAENNPKCLNKDSVGYVLLVLHVFFI